MTFEGQVSTSHVEHVYPKEIKAKLQFHVYRQAFIELK